MRISLTGVANAVQPGDGFGPPDSPTQVLANSILVAKKLFVWQFVTIEHLYLKWSLKHESFSSLRLFKLPKRAAPLRANPPVTAVHPPCPLAGLCCVIMHVRVADWMNIAKPE